VYKKLNDLTGNTGSILQQQIGACKRFLAPVEYALGGAESWRDVACRNWRFVLAFPYRVALRLSGPDSVWRHF